MYKIFEWITQLGQRDVDLECFSENLKVEIVKNMAVEDFIKYFNKNKKIREYNIDCLSKNEKVILKKIMFLQQEFIKISPGNKLILESFLHQELDVKFKNNEVNTSGDISNKNRNANKKSDSINYYDSKNSIQSRVSNNIKSSESDKFSAEYNSDIMSKAQIKKNKSSHFENINSNKTDNKIFQSGEDLIESDDNTSEYNLPKKKQIVNRIIKIT